MLEYLDRKFDKKDRETVSCLDDLPLWPAPFGLLLLEHLEQKSGMTGLDAVAMEFAGKTLFI